jgi:hypothetical protein
MPNSLVPPQHHLSIGQSFAFFSHSLNQSLILSFKLPVKLALIPAVVRCLPVPLTRGEAHQNFLAGGTGNDRRHAPNMPSGPPAVGLSVIFGWFSGANRGEPARSSDRRRTLRTVRTRTPRVAGRKAFNVLVGRQTTGRSVHGSETEGAHAVFMACTTRLPNDSRGSAWAPNLPAGRWR